MKVTVKEDYSIQLEDVFNGITLKTSSGEEMVICMRDSGFEFKYQGEQYFAKEGHVKPFHKSVRGNYLVSELQKHDPNLNEGAIPVNNGHQTDISGSAIKPPLGLIPKKFYYERIKAERFNDVCEAITRYYNAGNRSAIPR